MKIKGSKYVILYFTDWQMRQIKDVLGPHHDWHFAPVEFNGKAATGVRYMVPCPKDEKTMFLTDWQQREIEDETGDKCECISLDQIAASKYGVMP